ncbi:MAG: hypothetical protein JWP19_2215 [Rhodoglobus sp.]|nr:hypothetical protein [Rhodoglobus sp.]
MATFIINKYKSNEVKVDAATYKQEGEYIVFYSNTPSIVLALHAGRVLSVEDEAANVVGSI